MWWSGGWVDLGGAASPSLVAPPWFDVVEGLVATADAATAHTWGAWVEVDASLSADAAGILTNFAAVSTGSTNTATLVQIGTGGAGAETAWATFAVGSLVNSTPYGAPRYIPGFIAAGTRVAFRVQSAVLSKNVTISWMFNAVVAAAPGAPVSMGFDTATSRGTLITAPGSAGTPGAWTEVVASTSAAFTLLALFPEHGSGSMTAGEQLFDIGLGSAGAETLYIAEAAVVTHSSTEQLQAERPLLAIPVSIPAGSRISARRTYLTNNTGLGLSLVGA